MAVLPDNVLLEEAAALPVAGLTALRTLQHGAPLLGKRVLITGASQGIGRALLAKEVGDVVKVQSPGGVKELEILKLTTIHDAVD